MPLTTDALHAAMRSPVLPGVVAGLVIGKPVGIILFSWLAVRAGVARLPHGVHWRMIAGAGMLGGIGFTMALFIGGLAFRDAGSLDAAKVGVIAASTVAGIMGWLVLRSALRTPAS